MIGLNHTQWYDHGVCSSALAVLEPLLHFVCTEDQDLWLDLIFEHAQTTHSVFSSNQINFVRFDNEFHLPDLPLTSDVGAGQSGAHPWCRPNGSQSLGARIDGVKTNNILCSFF